jgi:hypothetical protein
MANQAIALQARAPQGNFLAPAIQQGAQFINMMSQQRAAERQAAVQQQQMEIQRAKEQRDITQAQIDNDGKKIDFYTKRAGQTMNAAGYELLLRDMEKDSPAFAEAFRANLPLERFDRNELLKMVGSVSDNFKATYGPLETQVVQLENGDYAVTVTGGYGKNTGVFELPGYKLAPRGAAPSAAPATPSATPPSAPATATGGMFRPAAFSADQGPDPQAALLASLNEAKQTGQIGADVVEQLRQLGGPQAAPRVDAFLAQNNIKVAPGGMQSAVYRPEGGAPMAQQVQFDPNAYVATGQTARGKPLMQSPMPGSAIVPLTRVREEAAAGRQTPAEAAAVASATATATKAAELKAEQAKKLPAKRQVSSLLQKLRNAYETLNTAEAIPSSERGAFANVFDYLSTTGAGREVQRALGTAANKPLNEITGARKLLATAIKNATGMSAQEMNSNVELQLTLDALTDPTQGYESAISQLDTLEQLYGAGGAQTPVTSAGRQTPTASAAAPPTAAVQMLRKNPTPAERKLFDSVFGAGAAAKALGSR